MKHLLPPEFVEDEIHVIVAGAGGNGSQFLSGLARMHLALRALDHHGFRVTVYDPDIVTEANVGRQLFSPSDVGQYKAPVLVNRINGYYGFNWQAYPTKLKSGGNSADILVGCVDSASARRELAKCRFDYWLDLGNTDKKGQVILGQPMEHDFLRRLPRPEKHQLEELNTRDRAIATRLPNVIEVFPELMGRVKEDDAPSCSLAEALTRQDLFINQTVTTFGLQLLWQFLREGGLNIHGYFINLETHRVTPLPI